MDLPNYGWSESIYNYLLNSKLTTIDERDEKQISVIHADWHASTHMQCEWHV